VSISVDCDAIDIEDESVIDRESGDSDADRDEEEPIALFGKDW
jgi:hypothetical protein